MNSGNRILYLLMVAFCLLLGILISLQFRTQSYGPGPELAGMGISELQAELAELEEENQKLRLDIADQREQVRDLMIEREGIDSQEAILRRELERARTYAGLTAVEGPGGTISVEGSDTATLQAGEMLIILNEFRAAGAHGLSVNGQRIVAMTEVRSVGTAGREIMVNGERISRDGYYKLRVIGERRSLENAWEMLAGLRRLLEQRGIRMNIAYSDLVRLPALPEHSPAYRLAYLKQSHINDENDRR